MSARALNVAALLVLSPVGLTAPARAATCQLSGVISINSLDSYYCDSSVLGAAACSSWKEVDLKTTSKPMPYMLVTVESGNGESLLAANITAANGAYATSWDQPSCTGFVRLKLWFHRVHESDVSKPLFQQRVRFQIVPAEEDGVRAVYATFVELGPLFLLTGASTSRSYTFPKTPEPDGDPDTDPIEAAQLANVYYTANSAITEMKSWHSRIDSTFSTSIGHADTLRIRFEDGWSGGSFFDSDARDLSLDESVYNRGMTIRHELGHAVHSGLLRFRRRGSCSSYRFGVDLAGPTHTGQHHANTCEWGHNATIEGLAEFFGVRSITTSDKGAWSCRCMDNSTQEICSSEVSDALTSTIDAPDPPGDDDRITICNGGKFVGVGDDFATKRLHCARMLTPDLETSDNTNGCRMCTEWGCWGACADADGDGWCDDYALWGHRNETAVTRFLWDVVDYNDENGMDNTDEDAPSFAATLAAMPCAADGAGYQVDHDCNEGQYPQGMSCNPLNDVGGDQRESHGFASRDSYNVHDFSSYIDKNQDDERYINCLDGAEP